MIKLSEKKLFEEKIRLEKMSEYEKKYIGKIVAGIDEVGRGPFAGPVVAAAVIFKNHEDLFIPKLNDSKKVSEKNRELLFDMIYERALSIGIGIVDNNVIDDINILQATYVAMREAISKLSVEPQVLLNDAVIIPNISKAVEQVKIIKGDTLSVSIAAASIIAKVTRDRLMIEYDSIYPNYGFAKNKGYGTKEHCLAIEKYGLTPIHRLSFTKRFQ